MNGALLQADTSKIPPLLYALTFRHYVLIKANTKKLTYCPLLVAFFFCLPLHVSLQPFLAST